jgi:hypothetical protein
MNFKSTKRQPKIYKKNYLISFGAFHFIVWLMMCLALGWRGIILGFLANVVIDFGLLLIWIWQEKKQPYHEVTLQQKENLFVRS